MLTEAGNWPLHGCKDLAELNAVIAELVAQRLANERKSLADMLTHSQRYEAIATKLGVSRYVVGKIAVQYQSLWLE
jgi:lysozyme family protein